MKVSIQLCLLLGALASCATSPSRPAIESPAPVATSVPVDAPSASATEGLRSPYGRLYRVGQGYAYRHWTW